MIQKAIPKSIPKDAHYLKRISPISKFQEMKL
jgi:hypothetical protein